MKAQVFVAVLPYSGLIFAQTTPDQRMASWLEAHRNMLEWFEGVPNMLVPDQCATAVDRTPRGLMETRRRQAVSGIRRALRDRGRAGARVRDHETRRRCGEAVDLVERWIVEPSRDETFRTIMDPGRLHRRTGHVAQPPARHSGAGFEAGTVPGRGTTDAAALLPAEPSGPCQWRKAKVLSCLWSNKAVRCGVVTKYTYDDGIRGRLPFSSSWRLRPIPDLAGNARRGNHRNMKSPWNRERFESWAEAIGPETRVMTARLLDSAPVVEQAYVPCNNILNLPRGNTGPNCLNRPPGKSTKRIVPRP